MTKYKRIEDKPTYLLFWETMCKPTLKFLGIIGTTITRTFRELFWTFAGILVFNKLAESNFEINPFLGTIMFLGVFYYNYIICKRSMRYN